MNIPFWKRWLSYLWVIDIDSTYSLISKDLFLVMRKGRLQLLTANAIYSYEDLYLNFTRSFVKLNINKSKELEVLILGFGLGSVPMVMERQGFTNCRFTGVEIDEDIIDMSSTYGLPKIKSPIELVQTDASSYITISEASFDLIIIDVFVDDKIPAEIQSMDFLIQVKQRLNADGLVMMNHLSATDKDQNESKEYFDGTFKQVFPQSDYIDVSGNWMLISDRSRIVA